MKILFLSQYFPPEVTALANRTYEHCKHWVDSGHEVTVVTCVPNHPRGVVYPGYKNKLYQKEIIDGINVIRLWTFLSSNDGSKIGRIFNYFAFLITTMLATLFLPKCDIVISTSPPLFAGLAGFVTSRVKRAPWILEIRDLWPESIVAVGAITNKKVIKILERIEIFMYKKCEHLVPVTDSFKEYMIEKGIPSDKITVIKNGINPLLISNSRGEGDELVSKLNLNDKFVVSYFGTHGLAQNLETVVRAAEYLKENENIIFLLAGDGAEKEKLVQMSDKIGLDNIIFVGQQPRKVLRSLWDVTAISLVPLRNSPLFKTVIPSKIFEAMALKKPIVIGVDGESRNIIESFGCGVYVEPDDSVDLAEKILQLSMDPELCKQMGTSGKECVTSHFDRAVLAKKYERIMQDTLTTTKTPYNSYNEAS